VRNLLGISVLLFMVSGALQALIGVLGTSLRVVYGTANARLSGSFLMGRAVDEQIFGKPPTDAVRENPRVGDLVAWATHLLCAFLIAFGLLACAVAWFALRRGEGWALLSLSVTHAVSLGIYWFVLMLPLLRDYHVGYFQTWHPLALVPTLLVPPATLLGWLALRSP
jgi:hypothetical protein